MVDSGEPIQQGNKEQFHEDPGVPEQLYIMLAESQKTLDLTRQKSEKCHDALLRTQAMLENERKRAARELEKMHKFAVSQLLMALLPIKDSRLELVLTTDSASDPQSLRQGMQLTLDKFSAVLADFGMETINPQGQPFHPVYHNAINMELIDTLPPNTVSRVHQKGYLLNGRVVRPAGVTVSMASDH